MTVAWERPVNIAIYVPFTLPKLVFLVQCTLLFSFFLFNPSLLFDTQTRILPLKWNPNMLRVKFLTMGMWTNEKNEINVLIPLWENPDLHVWLLAHADGHWRATSFDKVCWSSQCRHELTVYKHRTRIIVDRYRFLLLQFIAQCRTGYSHGSEKVSFYLISPILLCNGQLKLARLWWK